MEIDGRKALCYYVRDAGFHYLELAQKEGDCSEGRAPRDRLLCEGDCQGTYLSAMVRGNDITVIGTVHPKPHVMYNGGFLEKHALRTIREAQQYINRCIEREEYAIEPSMGGRRKRVYIKGEHAETLFDGCTFRHVQSQPYRMFLNDRRKGELEEIARRLPALKEQAEAVDLEDLRGKLEA